MRQTVRCYFTTLEASQSKEGLRILGWELQVLRGTKYSGQREARLVDWPQGEPRIGNLCSLSPRSNHRRIHRDGGEKHTLSFFSLSRFSPFFRVRKDSSLTCASIKILLYDHKMTRCTEGSLWTSVSSMWYLTGHYFEVHSSNFNGSWVLSF